MRNVDGVAVDPLRHIQEVAKLLGFYDRLGYKDYKNLRLHPIYNGKSCFAALSTNEGNTGKFKVNFFNDIEKVDYGKKGEWVDYVNGHGSINGKRFLEIDLRKDDLTVFGDFAANVDVYISAENQEGVFCRIDQKTPGIFRLNRTGICISPKSGSLIDGKKVVAVNGKDYRAYVHRMMEFYRGIQKPEWQAPDFYLKRDQQAQQQQAQAESTLDTVIELGINTLFSGSERTTLLEKIKNARLQIREGWTSVPKLSLGNVNLPERGMRDIKKDEFVMHAVPYMIEELVRLGIMEAEEAEKVIGQRLTNYFIHQTGFQLSEQRAEAILRQLQEDNQSVKQGRI